MQLCVPYTQKSNHLFAATIQVRPQTFGITFFIKALILKDNLLWLCNFGYPQFLVNV